MNKKPASNSNTFRDIFDGLSAKILRVNSAKTSDQIDSAMSRIADSIIDKDSSNFAEMIGRVYSDILSQSFNMKSFQRNIFQGYVNADRYIRYANAEEIVDCIPYCARALKVISDEVVAPDEITKTIIQFYQEENSSESSKNEYNNLKSINSNLKVETHIREIVYETLKLGDQFIEICDYTSPDIPVSQLVLNENESPESLTEDQIISRFKDHEITIRYDDYSENGNHDVKEETVNIKPVLIEAGEKETQGNKKDEIDISRVKLIVHDPRYVIKLQSPRFKLCLGYIILPSNAFGDKNNNSFGGGKNNPRLISLMAGKSNYRDMLGIDALYMDMMTMIKKHIGNKDIDVDKKEVKDMITRSIKEFDYETSMEFKIRFVPPEKMEHFCLSHRRFFPYGEGIFYKTSFSAKLLIALQTAITIKRLSDSSDKRIAYIETGTPRNVRDLIEDIKEATKKRKVSLDSMGNIGSIPSMITNYEDYYIPQNNGKKYVEFDTLQSNLNLRDLSDELKYFRDVLVSSLEVPPSYIGLEENLSNKSALSFENILFARTIVSYQTLLSKHLQNLFNKLYRFIHNELPKSDIKITFAPPKMLQMERDAENMRMIADIITTLTELGIDKKYLMKKYLPLEWEKVEESETTNKLDNKLQNKEDPLLPGIQPSIGSSSSQGIPF
jgi:hypothetical protein